MALALDQPDQAVLQLLQQQGRATIQDLCEAMSVTATAVRQRLNRLQDVGLIYRETIRTSRGRPHHAYVLTDAGRQQLGDNYAELAILLWDELRQIEEPAIRHRVLSKVEEQLSRRYGAAVTGTTVEQRFEQLRNVLLEKGFRVEVAVHNGLPVLREQHCPYHKLAVGDADICAMEQRVFERVLGVSLTLTQSCRNGYGCCEFHLTEPKPN